MAFVTKTTLVFYFLRNEAASNLNMKSSYFRTAKKNYTRIPMNRNYEQTFENIEKQKAEGRRPAWKRKKRPSGTSRAERETSAEHHPSFSACWNGGDLDRKNTRLNAAP